MRVLQEQRASRGMGTAALALLALVVLTGLAAPALAAEAGEAVQSASFNIPIPILWYVAPVGSVLALVFAWLFYKQVKGSPEGDDRMKEIAAYVRTGAYAYLRRQYKVVAVFFVVVSIILFIMGQLGVQHSIVFVAFLTGGFFSGLCGFLGMNTATLASNRTAQGAKDGLNRGLTVAFRAGAVMGLVVVGFGLLDIAMWFIILAKVAPMFGYHMNLVEITVVMLTFGMGASSQALFARVGGGIYTKAADVGADLVGKVEAGIPEDDPRNPATIADNVGDNVGDVAGMGADLYESYCGSILATAALGVAAAATLGLGMAERVNLLAAPMVLAGIGIALSILGIYMVRTREGATMKQLMGALNMGINGSSVMIIAAAFGVCYFLLNTPALNEAGVSWLGVWGSIVSGLVAGVLIGKFTEYYTSYDYKPTREVAEQSETGPATVIIGGIAEGMKSTWAPILIVMIAIMLSYAFAGGFVNMALGLYGVGIAAVGMLATLGITLATDAYGPIADNAGGNAEMTHQPPEVRKRTDALDSLGNTTAATGKGFAIGSAALTALALLAAYVEEVRIGQNREAEFAPIVAKADSPLHKQLIEYYDTQIKGKPATETSLYKATSVQAVYVGHNKGAMGFREEGKNTSSIGGGMFLMDQAMDKHPEIWKNADGTPRVFTLTTEEAGSGVFTQSIDVPAKDGQMRKMNIRFVPTPTASLRQYMEFYDVTLMNPKVLCGLFAGVLLVFLFSAMTMKAVGRAAKAMVIEVRRQFKEIVGIMEGTGKPDYARCVEISTAGAQREMIVPSLLALVVPIAVGLLLDVAGVLGLLAGGLACGFAMAVFMANAGGSWDNAKKYIETGALGGKGSANHKAAVTGDTVGDPFKDTSGPSLNIHIKLMSMVSVVFAGLIVKYGPQIGAWLGME